MRDTQDTARLFQILSSEARVRLLSALKKRPLCVNALAARLGVSPAAVSQHLRVLRGAGLVEAEKRGYYVHYRVNPEALRRARRVADNLLDTKPE